MILSTAHFLLRCDALVHGRLLVPVLEAMVPWTMHHHHATRQAIYFPASSDMAWKTNCSLGIGTPHACRQSS